ncbi:acetylglutamate kinase [Candidatus Soleaferrea massiliensis]|uniref:acetylglutamate kinase n=1 Tax=Candidatus Soleaferrea massiliensis TaxID=1470354 RepID=UPI0005911DD8|nr:acetylglutamate kinase [Candidatus Soleaferrea massiliensis]
MDISNTEQEQAKVLIQALPYMQKYYDKIVVVKYGGNAMINDELKQAVMSDIVLLSLIGIKVVLVHGGGPEITDMLNRVGKETKFVGGLRYTDKETAEIVQMVLAGKVNKELVTLLNRNKGSAIGLCGLDGNMIKVQKMQSSIDLGYVGEIEKIDVTIIHDCIDKGYIPVIATVGCDENGDVYNINADTAASRIASELGAENIILMTDIKGVLLDKNDPQTFVPTVNISEVPYLIKQGIISDGMIPKVECCVEAIRRGVNRAVMIDGRTPHSILIEIFSNEGIGTMFV